MQNKNIQHASKKIIIIIIKTKKEKRNRKEKGERRDGKVALTFKLSISVEERDTRFVDICKTQFITTYP